jgi:choline dehydrogenase-like flavoprotein
MGWVDVVHTAEGCIPCAPLTSPKVAKSLIWAENGDVIGQTGLCSRAVTARHVSGTCQMGPDTDPMAVVDQYCRVKGVHGLWVVDASVMPRIPRSGGAHATVIMIGERVVDWVAGRVPVSNR